MVFSVTILGSSSAIPTQNRNPSAQVLQHHNNLYLIDCGEGTQMQMRRFNIKTNHINHIFISHLHGDHYLGLMGLLSSYHLMGRKKDLHIYAPPELEEIITIQKKSANTDFSFKVIFHNLSHANKKLLYEDDKISVSAIALKHRIPTFGFIFSEKNKEIKIYKEAICAYNLSIEDIKNIKNGNAYYDKQGRIVHQGLLCKPLEGAKTYAYISDTIYDESIIKKIKDVDLLYHEATFADELKDIATEKFHSTARQAATIALKAKVKKLLIGHFSARYKTVEPLLAEARSVFPNTYSAEEGINYII